MLTLREKLILLNRVTELGSTPLRKLIDAFGSVDALWQAPPAAIAHASGVRAVTAARVAACRSDEAWLQQELRCASQNKAAIVTQDEPQYPQQLRTIPDPPPVLYVWGRLPPSERPSVAIVGSRRASLYGLGCAEKLGCELAERGIAVVSGMALGIDAAAHRGALKAAGATVAVLGSGLSRLYPPEHAKLAGAIVQKGGAVVSEYPMQTQPLPNHFPRRNRIISGLSLGVVVVEAGRRSGALITTDCALEQGREVFAVPGPMTSATSQGTHGLIAQGARLITGVEDILEELGLLQKEEPAKKLSEAEERLLSATDKEPVLAEAIAAKAGLERAQAAAGLLQLELKGCIKQLPGRRFMRVD